MQIFSKAWPRGNDDRRIVAVMREAAEDLTAKDAEKEALRKEVEQTQRQLRETAHKATTLAAANARMREALEKISCPSQTFNLLWWQIEARAALQGDGS